ncbi:MULTISPECIES: PAS domain-containing protein [Ramlibacter]|uniref:Virulence sensor protein BvgS n=1 Tax=Ramlibacter pinisoli TaxID=2682844 RepID=A0A6N8IWK4_9BURK|nr:MULTISPECIES: PAS domain-containing protein [Ramlibacter]MBA2961405.1 PAS domain-containing protein [Ramlibacter sp. CGMCC 1.13660]MVQ31349.1 PAS domain-containing protein [Ramlibacter pinisoli]
MSIPLFLSGGGAVGAQLRNHPWTDTPLGPPQTWPPALQALVQIMLASNQPMFLVWGPQRTYLYNDIYTPILGGKHPQALGRDVLEVWSEIRADIEPIVDQAYRGEPVQRDDMALEINRHGYPETAHFSFFYSPIRGPDGTVDGFFCAVNETTRQVQAQEELRRSEARHRGVLSRMDEGFLLLDEDFHIAEVNDYTLRLCGLAREQMVGRCHWEVFPGSRELEVGRAYLRAMAEGRPFTLDHLYEWPDGRKSWIELRGYRTPDGLALFFRDVAERRRFERQAAESAERVQLALDAGAIVGTFVWDVAADRVVADERFARTFGLDVAACHAGVPLQGAFASIHPDDRQRVQRMVAEAMQRGGPYRCEYRVIRHDGLYHPIEAIGRCELDAQGRPVRFPGILVDVEDRRRAEAERDRANALLRTFIEAVPGVVYAKDRDGRLMLGNRGTAELIGRPPEQFIGRTDLEVLGDKRQAAVVMENDRRIMESGRAEQVEEIVPMPDGQAVHWLSHKAPLFDAQGAVVGLVGASIDITDRKREQERARTETEMLDLLNQTGALLSGELDLDALLQSVTDAATKLTGAQFGAFFYNGVDAQGETYMLFSLSGAPREAFEHFGQPRPTPMFEPTFRGGPPIRLDDVRKDPRYGGWGPHHGMPPGHLPVRSYLAVSVVSRSGEVIGGLFFGHPEPGVFTERSERLATGIASQAAVAIDNAHLYAEAQRAAAERTQLLESERAARADAERASTLKDEFLATLSHELRTPLSAILGWAHILRRKTAGDPSLARGIDVIERSTRVQTQLIEDLLDMSRITSGKLRLDMQPIAPVTFVQAAVDAVRPAAEAARVSVRLVLEEPVAAVMGDSARLQQVVGNLLTNAIKFSPADGRVLVRVGGDEERVRIEVDDDGIGIAPEFLPHVFDRFRQADGSTTRRFGGLGLGLSIVRHLVDLHGGTVEARSRGLGQGSTFVFTLPSHAMAVLRGGEAQVPLNGVDVDLQGLPVLVVDDEPDVLDLLSRVLGEARAQVTAVADAEAALDAFASGRPGLLISDIGMPGMDGYELIRRLRRTPPAGGVRVPAIALTAFARPEDRQRALDSGFDAYLSKPVEPHELLAQVRRLALLQRPAAQR